MDQGVHIGGQCRIEDQDLGTKIDRSAVRSLDCDEGWDEAALPRNRDYVRLSQLVV